MSVGTRLRDARNDMDMKQVDFADMGGVGRYAQIRFERDENLPGGAYWLALFAAGIDTHYILTGLRGAMTTDEDALPQRYRAADEVGKAMMMGVVAPKLSGGR